MHSQLYNASRLALKSYKESTAESKEKGAIELNGMVIIYHQSLQKRYDGCTLFLVEKQITLQIYVLRH